jgi:hypothetical protein
MTLAEYSMTAFTLLNGGRTAAYFPQFVRIYRDPHDAAAVSLVTWGLFAAANVATVSYAMTGTHDHLVAIVFAMNAIGCLAIFGVTAFKRFHEHSRVAMVWHWIVALRQSQLVVGNDPSASSPHSSPGERDRDRMLLELAMRWQG